jgi:hypothetical protein
MKFRLRAPRIRGKRRIPTTMLHPALDRALLGRVRLLTPAIAVEPHGRGTPRTAETI